MFEGLGNIFKLREALNKCGIGFLSSPEQIKIKGIAYAEVRRHEMLMIAQAEFEIQQIKQGKKQYLTDGSIGNFIELSGSDNEMADKIDCQGNLEQSVIGGLYRKIEQQKHTEEIQQEININKTINLAEEELFKAQQEPSEKNVDSDWLYRWRENAKDTTNDELRQLWAKALAGEVKSPGSYSLRTLEFIKNISQEEAQAIAKLGPFVTFTGTIYKVPLFEKIGFDFAFLLKMDEMGIVSGFGNNGRGVAFSIDALEHNKGTCYIVSNNYILILEAKQPGRFELEGYRISKVGGEVLSLGDFIANKEYMIEIGQKIKSKGVDVKIADYVQDHTGDGNYFNVTQI